MTTKQTSPCPCGKKENDKPLSYSNCCSKFHQFTSKAQTPEALMRSRFCAFVYKEYDYLITTHHPEHLNGLTSDELAKGGETQWLSLEIISSSISNMSGQVKFQAWYEGDNGIDAIHELSDFVCEDGNWLYTKGEQYEAIFPKRNQKCICGSGKKFKQCCSK